MTQTESERSTERLDRLQAVLSEIHLRSLELHQRIDRLLQDRNKEALK